MIATNLPGIRNRLLLQADWAGSNLTRPLLEPVDMPRGFVLARQNEVISDVYFPEDGVASMIMALPEGQELETGLFGLEGFGPAALVLGSDRAPIRCVMQVGGRGFRVSASALTRAVDADPALRLLLTRFAHTLAFQVACTSLANVAVGMEQRLARWLLMCRDRLSAEDMPLTHEFLGIMLGVRRASVTVALHVLEGANLIRAQRGSIAIRDRPALEALAASAYGQPEAEYRRLLGDA